MKLINASAEVIPQPKTLKEAKQICEFAGRVCYHSTDKITDDSYMQFIDNLIKSQHYSPLEHCPIYLVLPDVQPDNMADINWFNYSVVEHYLYNPYSRVTFCGSTAYVSTSLRVLVENERMSDISYWSAPTEYHVKRISAIMDCSIHVYKDLTRHRKMSFAIESTRFNNYSNDKFGNQLTFIEPTWLSKKPEEQRKVYSTALEAAETYYMSLIEKGWKPQEAAQVLPQALAAKVMMTGFEDDWCWVFELRTALAKTGKPLPQIEELMNHILVTAVKSGDLKLPEPMKAELQKVGINI